MAITKSAKKRIKSSENKRIFNLRRLRTMKEEVKNFLKAITKKDTKEAEKILPTLYKAIDKALKNNVIKKNNAARKKSRFAKKIAELK
jgi:small subunit ribosomal protein S20